MAKPNPKHERYVDDDDSWLILEEPAEKDWATRFNPNHLPGGSPEGGQFSSGGGEGGGGESNYGLVQSDVAKFHQLKAQWATTNNQLLQHVDKPDGPESKALLDKLEGIVKEMHTLHADPGGPGGIGLPGGPRDVTIVGAGPGGLSASIMGGAEGLDTLVVEANVVAGGQAKFSSRIENFPGFPVGVTGQRLTQNMFEQANRLGAESKLGVRVTEMTYDSATGLKHITLSNGEHIDSRTVILAGGLEFRRMPFPGSDGPGVIVGDGQALAKAGAGGNVCVIGGSNGAAQAALGCAAQCNRVYLLARSGLTKSMSDYQIEAVRNNPKITVIENDQIAKLNRDKDNNPTSLETVGGKVIPVKAVGQFLGSLPDTKWVPAGVDVVKGGRIHTNADLETHLPGVFAVGDMRDGAIGRIGVAVGEGQLALRQANLFLDKLRQHAEGQAAQAASFKAAKEPNIPVDALFDLDRANPWFGQTVEGVTPLSKKKLNKDFDESKHPRDDHGRWTEGGGGGEGDAAEVPGEKKPLPEGGKNVVNSMQDFVKDGIDVKDVVAMTDFLDAWNSRIGKSPKDFKNEYFGKGAVDGRMFLKFDEWHNKIEVVSYIENKEGADIGQLHSDIDLDKNTAHLDRFYLEKQHTGQDIAKKVLASQIQMYKDMGLHSIDLIANIDVGIYAWARYGFAPSNDREWEDLSSGIRYQIKQQTAKDGGAYSPAPKGNEIPKKDAALLMKAAESHNPKSLWVIADSKYGHQLLQQNKVPYWEGVLRFNDERAMARFGAYVHATIH